MSDKSAVSINSDNEFAVHKLNSVSTSELAGMEKEEQRGQLSVLMANLAMADEKHTVEGNTAVTPETEASGTSSLPESATLGQEQQKLLRLLSEITDQDSFIHHMEKPKYVKVFRKKRGLKQFRKLFLAQELVIPSDHTTVSGSRDSGVDGDESAAEGTTQDASERDKPVLFIKFSKDGKYMATGGKGYQLHVWKVIASPMERWGLDSPQDKGSRSPSKKRSLSSSNLCKYTKRANGSHRSNVAANEKKSSVRGADGYMYAPVFHPTPFKTFSEHTQSILDCDWSKNGFILTASMDKYAKLWHCERKNSLKSFSHPDFVTCIRFHPSDDRYFLTGCLDHVLRIWSILEDRIAFEYDCNDLITSMDISEHGKYTIIGTFNGYVHILYTKGLQECHSFHVLDKTGANKDRTRRGPKITGVEFLKGGTRLKAMVTSNDSRIRIFDVEAASLLEKLHGFNNASSQLCAHHMQLDNGMTLVLSGSEDHWIYAWILRSDLPDLPSTESSSGNQNRKDSTSTKSDDSARRTDNESTKRTRRSSIRLSGTLKQFFKKTMSINSNGSKEELPPRKVSRNQATDDKCVKNSVYITFHAQHHPLTAAVTAPKETCQVLSLSNDLICEMTMAFWDNKFDYLLTPDPKTRAKVYGPDALETLSRRGSDVASLRAPTLMQSIGMITVSADVMGNIRVFRNDISTNIRTKFLNMLRNNASAPLIPGDRKIPDTSSSKLSKK